jgi:spore germination cell wall hydrolase CwlJ-like protein
MCEKNDNNGENCVTKVILNVKKLSLVVGIGVLLGIFFLLPEPRDQADAQTIETESQICLAKNIYFEARDQGLASKMAVSLVVLNRVKHKQYPSTICEVIYQGPTYSWKSDFPVRNKCQFSWYCDGKSDKPKEREAWISALDTASLILYSPKSLIDFTEGATHYHATHILPHWAAHLVRVGRIEDHIFYRWES